MRAGIVAAIERTGILTFRGDVGVGVDDLRVARRDGDFGAADARREPVGQRLPRRPAVGRFEDAAARHLERGADFPRRLPRRPQRRIDRRRIVRIDCNRKAADVVVLEEHPLERRAAIERAIDAAFGVRSVRVAQHGNEKSLRIIRIDGHPGDLLPVAQTEMRPRLPAVDRLIDAVADGEIGALQSLAAAGINNSRIARRYRKRTDRTRRLPIEDRHPRASGIFSPPNSTVDGGYIKQIGPPCHTRQPDRSPTPQRPHKPPVQCTNTMTARPSEH